MGPRPERNISREGRLSCFVQAPRHQPVWGLGSHVTFTFFLSTIPRKRIPPFRNPYKTFRSLSEVLPFHFLSFLFRSPTCRSTPAPSAATQPELRAAPGGIGGVIRGRGEADGRHRLPLASPRTFAPLRLAAEEAAAPSSPPPANSRACGLEDNCFQPCVVS